MVASGYHIDQISFYDYMDPNLLIASFLMCWLKWVASIGPEMISVIKEERGGNGGKTRKSINNISTSFPFLSPQNCQFRLIFVEHDFNQLSRSSPAVTKVMLQLSRHWPDQEVQKGPTYVQSRSESKQGLEKFSMIGA